METKPLLSKYYVISGELRVAILGGDEIDAALRAIQTFSDKTLGKDVFVNQHGFDTGTGRGDHVFKSDYLLSQLGLY